MIIRTAIGHNSHHGGDSYKLIYLGTACAKSEPLATKLFVTDPECVETTAAITATLRPASPTWPSPSWKALAARLLVDNSFTAPGFNTNVVNRSPPDLFPGHVLVNKQFIRRETRSVAP